MHPIPLNTHAGGAGAKRSLLWQHSQHNIHSQCYLDNGFLGSHSQVQGLTISHSAGSVRMCHGKGVLWDNTWLELVNNQLIYIYIQWSLSTINHLLHAQLRHHQFKFRAILAKDARLTLTHHRLTLHSEIWPNSAELWNTCALQEM